MKRFIDLTDKEVYALTPEEVGYWIDLECAFEGIPLLPKEPVEPPAEKFHPDMTVYVVGGVNFANFEDASKFCKWVNNSARFDLEYTHGPRYEKIAKEPRPIEVSSLNVFSVGGWNVVKDEAKKYSKLHNEYSEAKREYDAIAKKRNVVVDRVNRVIDEVNTAERNRRRVQEKFNRYLELANNEREIALKFLIDAQPDAKEILPELWESEQKEITL